SPERERKRLAVQNCIFRSRYLFSQTFRHSNPDPRKRTKKDLFFVSHFLSSLVLLPACPFISTKSVDRGRVGWRRKNCLLHTNCLWKSRVLVMEGGSTAAFNSGSFDKSRVLDVKPLRTLVPVFPSSGQGPPFVCSPPFGPYPPGFAPFYPFSPQQQVGPEPNQEPQAPTPLRSFRAPQSVSVENGEGVHSDPPPKRKAGRPARDSPTTQKKVKRAPDDFFLPVPDSSFDLGISPAQKEDGDRSIVVSLLMRFDALRRKISQLEDVKETHHGNSKGAHLKACATLMSNNVRTNSRKRTGMVPGVEIGDIFFFRMEMCLVGLHSQTMAGIDYMIVRGDLEEEPLATSIVSSGYYDNSADDSDVLIYSGHGGSSTSKKGASDQKLERGNLALERSLRRGSQVRVIRGMKDGNNTATKVYVYDGLYTIQESWVEKANTGCNIFKYKLVRMPGQPDAFSVWKSIEKWKEGVSPRVGLILPDLTSGAESLPVSLVNDVDEERGPAHFSYVASVKYSKSFKLSQHSLGCNCRNACQANDENCSCMRLNGNRNPYIGNGALISRKPLVYECGPTCPCIANCKNRVSQTGLKVHLEVFKTKDRGWGLRSWDPIRAGGFICVYAGEATEKGKLPQNGEGSDGNDYVFDTTRVYDPFRWNCEPGLIDEDLNDNNEQYDIPYPLVINAKHDGNVARFMNHSCEPNTFWQPVVYENNNETHINIAFFAMRHIPPMTELTFDYGISRSHDGGDSSASHGRKKCLCRSSRCKGYFG
ncbi:Histone-lysine N-methyltransferase, H3 lysine-9 specific SUVH3, partial [Linum perenne]